LPTPTYAHLPVITDDRGQKFSKQNHAPALNDEQPATNLRQALQFLRQEVPPAGAASVTDILAHAVEHWSIAAIPRQMALTASDA
jgi:glutamyl-Q tRNA(Asp) synthetase